VLNFSLLISFQTALGLTQSHIQWVSGAPFYGVKLQKREGDHSPPFSADVKKGGAIHPLPYIFMASRLINLAQELLYLFVIFFTWFQVSKFMHSYRGLF
jgi:hypothetical protein